MKFKEYVKLAMRTLSSGFHFSPANNNGADPAFGSVTPNVIHAGFGIASEAGEISDAIKKSLFYGKPLDLTNLREEVGDIQWYLALLCMECGFDMEEIQRTNIEKLRKRFPEKFTQEAALNRDLDAEREVLEGGAQSGPSEW